MPVRLSTDPWSRHCFLRRAPKDPNIVGARLQSAAGCSWMRKAFWILCGGDYGGVVTALETSVTVWEIDRRVLLVHVAVEVGLITCVWSQIGQAARHSTPVSGGTRVYSTSTQRGWGRWSSGHRARKWGRDWRETDKRNVQQRHGKRDGNECREMRNTESFYLEPIRCAHIGKVL